MKAIARNWLAGAALALAAHGLLAQNLPSAKPEDVGLSSERLARLGAWARAEVDAKRVPGAVILVARNGKLAYYEAIGQQDPGAARRDGQGQHLPHLLDDQTPGVGRRDDDGGGR